MDVSHDSVTANPAGSPVLEVKNQTGTSDQPEAEFDRFADLTGKLVSVSKAELDERLAAER